MSCLWLYLYLSLVMGLILTVFEVFYTEDGRIDKPIDREQDRGLQQAVEGGHIQKEIYGDRTIYYPVTDRGKQELKATEFVEKIYSNYKLVYLLIGFVMLVVIWPYELCILIRGYAD